MRLSDLLTRFAWWRRLQGGTWLRHNGRWHRVETEEPPDDLSDDPTRRQDLQPFLTNQREV